LILVKYRTRFFGIPGGYEFNSLISAIYDVSRKTVEMAHRLALESEYITSDMIESAEFPHLVTKYGVMGVPKVVINEEFGFEGALPESSFVDEVMKASK